MATVKKSKKKIIVPISIILVIAIVAGCIFGVAKSKSGEEVKLNTISTGDIYEKVSLTGDVTAGTSKDYKVGTVANSCSTMHKIQAKEFTMDDFSCEHLMGGYLEQMRRIIDDLNNARKYFTVGDQFFSPGNKRDWWQMIQLLPSSYNQTRNVMMNYEVLANIYKSRKDHKLDEWRNFCKWIEDLPYSELITGGKR